MTAEPSTPQSAPQPRALRHDAVLVAAGQVLAVSSAFVLTVVGARLLTTEDFGALSWALSWLTYLAVIAQFGLTQVATVTLAGSDVHAHRLLVRRLLVGQAMSLAVVLATWVLLGPVAAGSGSPAEVYRPLVALLALWLPAAAVGPVVVNALRARGRFALSLVFGEHVRRVVLVAVLLWASTAAGAVPLRAAVTWAVALESVCCVVSVVVLLRVTRSHPPADAAGTPSPWGLLRFGSAFSVATVASVTVPQAGVWVLAAFAPADEVAVFAVAVRIALLVATPTTIVMRSLAPRLAAGHRAGTLDRLQAPIRRAALWSATATTLAVLVVAAGGSRLLPAVFGQAYGEALTPALVLCAGVLVNAWTGPCSVVLSHAGRQRVVAGSAAINAVAFFGLAAWWADLAGATGVAAAAALVMSLRNLHLAQVARRSLGVSTLAWSRRTGR